MASTIKTKNRTTDNTPPTTGDIVQGELAINFADEVLYSRDEANNIIILTTKKGTVSSALQIWDGTNWVQNINATVTAAGLATFTALQVSGAVNINSTLAVSGKITANSGIAFPDSDKATFGTGNDLEIYHDASNSYITDVGTGNLKIGGANVEITTAGGSKYFQGAANVAKLYHTGNERLATSSSGVVIGGTITATGTSVFASLDISGDIDVDGTTNLDVVDIDGAVNMASTLAVSGTATFSGDVYAGGATEAYFSSSEAITAPTAAFRPNSATVPALYLGNATADGPIIKLMDATGTSRGVFSVQNSTAKTLLTPHTSGFKVVGNQEITGTLAVTGTTTLGLVQIGSSNSYLQEYQGDLYLGSGGDATVRIDGTDDLVHFYGPVTTASTLAVSGVLTINASGNAAKVIAGSTATVYATIANNNGTLEYGTDTTGFSYIAATNAMRIYTSAGTLAATYTGANTALAGTLAVGGDTSITGTAKVVRSGNANQYLTVDMTGGVMSFIAQDDGTSSYPPLSFKQKNNSATRTTLAFDGNGNGAMSGALAVAGNLAQSISTAGANNNLSLRNTNAGATALTNINLGTDLSTATATITTFSEAHTNAGKLLIHTGANRDLVLGTNGTDRVTVDGINGGVTLSSTLDVSGVISHAGAATMGFTSTGSDNATVNTMSFRVEAADTSGAKTMTYGGAGGDLAVPGDIGVAGQLELAGGSGSNPSVTFGGDVDNGFYYYTSNTVGASGHMHISGNTAIVGSLSKGSGSFRIDHPLKPDTHHLVHSFTESPQADLLYSGSTALVNGSAQVNLDEYHGMTEGTFVALNRNIRVFTTNETDWEPIRGYVKGNTLYISCQDSSCSDSVSWLVIGERHDQHMMDTEWTDDEGRVIVEPLKPEPKDSL